MKGAIICFLVAVGFAHGGLIPATQYVRAPAHDSAIIKSDRLGGNFAYSTVEGHAYAAISPVVQRVSEPVAVSYNAHQVNLGYAAAPVVHAAPIAHYAAPVAHYAAPVAQYASYATPIAHQQYYHYAPSVVAAPTYPQYFGNQHLVAANPVFGGIAQNPAAPIESSPLPVASVQEQPQPQAPASDSNDDTVSVESA